jgi:hypothetical protein
MLGTNSTGYNLDRRQSGLPKRAAQSEEGKCSCRCVFVGPRLEDVLHTGLGDFQKEDRPEKLGA